MWIYALTVAVELMLLFFLSRLLTQKTYFTIFLLTRSRAIGISITTLFLFPGTVIHELSHLFTAEILGVHTGKLSLTPESIEEPTIQSGSVMIAQTDPFRRAIIGLAPLIIGTITVAILSYFLPQWSLAALSDIESHLYLTWETIRIVITLYAIIAISNTMFSSDADMKGVIPLGITLTIIVLALSITGVYIVIPIAWTDAIQTVLLSLAQSLGVVIGLNLVGLVFSAGLMLAAEKITGRKITIKR